ncbi:MAG: ABC transporter permease [Eubacteriales bacterium]
MVKQIVLILFALLLATIFLAVSKYDAFAILEGVLNSLTQDLAGTIRWSIPLILAGLAICVTYKAEIYNLGVDGQIIIGAAAATAVALSLPEMPTALALTIVFLSAMLGGALMALIPGALKVLFNTDEVVSTLLLNFLAEFFLLYLIVGPMRDPEAAMRYNASALLPEYTWLPRFQVFAPSTATVGLYIALAVAAIMVFLFYKTRLGYEIRIVGANANLARYGGMNPKRLTITVMLISGAIAGIIGAIEVCAVQHKLIAGFNPGFGFDGIVISLLANNNPVGVVFSGFFLGLLYNGGINMERFTDVPSAITDIVMAIIIITISAKLALPLLKKRYFGKRGKDAQKEIECMPQEAEGEVE